jgi:hypothetical protein
VFDAAIHVIPVRWNAKRLFESAAEMKGAQPDKLCERAERQRFGKVLLYMGSDDALLPRSKSASRRRSVTSDTTVDAQQFMCRDLDKRLGIALILGATLDCFGQLDRGLP